MDLESTGEPEEQTASQQPSQHLPASQSGPEQADIQEQGARGSRTSRAPKSAPAKKAARDERRISSPPKHRATHPEEPVHDGSGGRKAAEAKDAPHPRRSRRRLKAKDKKPLRPHVGVHRRKPQAKARKKTKAVMAKKKPTKKPKKGKSPRLPY